MASNDEPFPLQVGFEPGFNSTVAKLFERLRDQCQWTPTQIVCFAATCNLLWKSSRYLRLDFAKQRMCTILEELSDVHSKRGVLLQTIGLTHQVQFGGVFCFNRIGLRKFIEEFLMDSYFVSEGKVFSKIGLLSKSESKVRVSAQHVQSTTTISLIGRESVVAPNDPPLRISQLIRRVKEKRLKDARNAVMRSLDIMRRTSLRQASSGRFRKAWKVIQMVGKSVITFSRNVRGVQHLLSLSASAINYSWAVGISSSRFYNEHYNTLVDSGFVRYFQQAMVPHNATATIEAAPMQY